MKKLELICPKCNSANARQYGWKNMRFFDDDFYDFLKAEFGEMADCENYYTANCICDDCDHHFDVKVIINVFVLKLEY